MASADRIALVRAFLERSFPGHTVAPSFHNMTTSHVFRVDAPAPDGRSRYWLAISEEAMGDQDFDLGAELTPRLVEAMKNAGASRSVVVLTTNGAVDPIGASVGSRVP